MRRQHDHDRVEFLVGEHLVVIAIDAAIGGSCRRGQESPRIAPRSPAAFARDRRPSRERDAPPRRRSRLVRKESSPRFLIVVKRSVTRRLTPLGSPWRAERRQPPGDGDQRGFVMPLETVPGPGRLTQPTPLNTTHVMGSKKLKCNSACRPCNLVQSSTLIGPRNGLEGALRLRFQPVQGGADRGQAVFPSWFHPGFTVAVMMILSVVSTAE